MSARQYDVFENPIPRARRAFPFVAILQSELADTGTDRIIAPLVPRARIAGATGRLLPMVEVLGVEHVLIVPRIAPVPEGDLHEVKDSLNAWQNDIVTALDLLFLGV